MLAGPNTESAALLDDPVLVLIQRVFHLFDHGIQGLKLFTTDIFCNHRLNIISIVQNFRLKPPTMFGHEVDTTNLAFSLTSKVFDKARLKLSYRYDERDNGTLQDDWTGVIAETFVSGTDTNIPYSFERSTLHVSADYDLFKTVRISAGYDRKTIDRDFQEVAEQTEDGSWGRLRWRPNGALQFDIKGGASRREIDRYDESLAASLGQNPLLRKYNLAFRYRTFGELTFVASFPESPVTITLNDSYAADSYTQSRMGLTSGDELRLAGDLSWAIGDRSSLYLSGGYENIESEQFGSELFAREDWNATNNDKFYTAGGGLRVREIGGKFDLQLDYTRSQGTSEINVTSVAAGPSRFPDLESTLDYLRLLLSYQQSDRLELTVNRRLRRNPPSPMRKIRQLSPTTRHAVRIS